MEFGQQALEAASPDSILTGVPDLMIGHQCAGFLPGCGNSVPAGWSAGNCPLAYFLIYSGSCPSQFGLFL